MMFYHDPSHRSVSIAFGFSLGSQPPREPETPKSEVAGEEAHYFGTAANLCASDAEGVGKLKRAWSSACHLDSVPQLGANFCRFFFGVLGSLTKIDTKEEMVPTYSNLSTGGPSGCSIYLGRS